MAATQSSGFTSCVAPRCAGSNASFASTPRSSASSYRSLNVRRFVEVKVHRQQSKESSLRIQCAAVIENVRVRKIVETTAKNLEVEEIASGVWTFTQPLGLTSLGLDPRLRMTVVKLPSGDLWLHSPVQLTREVSAILSNLGPVGHIVIGNTSPEHGFFARGYTAAYPKAILYAPVEKRQLSFAVRWKLPDVEVLGPDAPEAWAGVIDQAVVKVNIPGFPVECLFCIRGSGILLSDDLLFYGDDDSYKFAFNRWTGRLLNLYKQVGGILPPYIRQAKRLDEIQHVLDALQSWEFDTLVGSHLSAPVPGAKSMILKALSLSS